ncbi:FRG domain-containing protein [Enterococcus sp. CWB-B31]|uniref:FRG domain-containing protein n=1 Tax=Enterococcus sp. CWB-B31 TaxID=2885159 RepID=UPI001E36B9AB|nr:FRG domain-containing protein [Enterococcus sp. CWB-B31]MCB5953974.1 FRG domain-containing protein [Enterococcus sp. CWB-B31]
MNKIMHISEFLDFTMKYPETVFYRGESMDYGETACTAMAIRDALNYDMYSSRIDFFDRKIRENALFDKPDLLLPYAQHSGLATKLLDITSNALVALYFACQKANDTSDGYVYVFDDYADATEIFEKYPRFDLENELLKHVNMLSDQLMLHSSQISSKKEDHVNEQNYLSIEHDELNSFGKCIERYRQKYLCGGHSKHSIGRGISKEDSSFVEKKEKLNSLICGIKSWIIKIVSGKEEMATMLLPTDYTENTPAIDFVHPYKEKRYSYYNEQYREFDLEVREYLISLECLIAFLYDRSAVGNLASIIQLDNLKMDFLPNLLYRPVMTFKRGLSQESAFFSQTLFDKHELNLINDVDTMKPHQMTPRQLLKCQANYTKKIVIDGNSKETILAELDKIGVNKATMFGDADSIASYIMSTFNNKSSNGSV